MTIKTKPVTRAYRDGYDRIYGTKPYTPARRQLVITRDECGEIVKVSRKRVMRAGHKSTTPQKKKAGGG